MKSIKIFIFLMAVCTLCFCSLSLHAQTQRELTLKALTRRDWIWQVNTNFLIYYHFDKDSVSILAYGRSINPFYATHYPNEYECSYWGTYPYYLSDSVPSVFEHEKVGNMKRGRYWVTLSGKNILSVYEIIEFTGDRFILNDNDPRYKRVYKANKRTKLSKLMKKKSRSKKDKLR